MFSFFNNLKIRTKLFLVISISLTGFVVYSAFGYITFNLVKVDGPVYKNIIYGKDTIADVLPPPKYIIESFLICHRMLLDPGLENTADFIVDSMRLEREYHERQQYWLEELPAGRLKEELTELSHNPAEEFFKIRDEEYFPLIQDVQTEKAREVLNLKLRPLYEEHRRHVDEVVSIASQMNMEYEQYSRKIVLSRGRLLILLGLFLVVSSIVLVSYLIRHITFPLLRLTNIARKISAGDLSAEARVSDSNDEIGALANSVEDMRISLKSTLGGLKEEIYRRQQVENELIFARDTLEIKVQERTAEIEEINESLLVEVEERRRTQVRLDTQYSVARILADADTISEAFLKILQLVCESAKWDFGEVWLVDREAGVLHCERTWYKPVDGLAGFDAASRQQTFALGDGLPGRVWMNKEACWVEDVAFEANFSRTEAAMKDGLRGAFAFPIRLGDEILGIFDFFSRSVRKLDLEMLAMFSAVGSQVGQFIERLQAQEALKRFNAELEDRVLSRTSQLEESNKKLSEANTMSNVLLDTIPFYMDIVDEEGNILMLSPKFEAVIGKEWQGRKCWEIYKDDKSQCPHCPLRKESCCDATETVETAGVLGGKIFSISHSSLIYQGRKAILEIFQDITEHKLSEWQLRKAHDDLKSAQAQLVQSAKMASVGQLAGGVAHEINNPLTGVLNNVQLIKMELANKKEFDISDFRGILDIIEESAFRCSKITRSLLDFSHAAKETMHPISLNEAVEKVVTLIGHEMKLQNIALEKQLSPDLPLILGNFQLIQQIIFDIITNAKWAIHKKSPSGTIIIKTWHDPQEARVCISLSDTGIGIPQENLNRIFEPFFTTKPVGEGTGLGLAIVYNIIKEHKGQISVESCPGDGATFTISLPAGQAGLPAGANGRI